MALSVGSALEPNCQFMKGYSEKTRVGEYKAPATAQVQGTVVKLSSDGETLEVCGDNDGVYMLQQPCELAGPTGNAENREKWLQGIPQHVVECGQEISVQPIKSGAEINTNVVATGSDTGAITDATITCGSSEVECYGGIWRLVQGSNTPLGVINCAALDSEGRARILFY